MNMAIIKRKVKANPFGAVKPPLKLKVPRRFVPRGPTRRWSLNYAQILKYKKKKLNL